MDAVFDSQFAALRDAFLGRRPGVDLRVAYTAAGEVDYVYEAGRLVASRSRLDEVRGRDWRGLTNLRVVEPEGADRGDSLLALLTCDELEDGRLTVPEALDLVDEELGPDNPALRDGPEALPLLTPSYVVHISRICPAGEPEVPLCAEAPCPPVCASDPPKRDVVIGVSDTGLLADWQTHPWLANVVPASAGGEEDPLDPPLANGLALIPRYAGHGTFAAGVLATQAPGVRIVVNNHFASSGGELEWVMVEKLRELVTAHRPAVVNLSAGTYARREWRLLGFGELLRQWRADGVLLVAAAGNDATSRRFYPAAFEDVLAVGALGADGRNRAWFSNHGSWVDVYALGEGMVNAYASGEYRYAEPPKRPARQVFSGVARWDGTSFSAPLVAGLVAARLAAGATDPYAVAEDLRQSAETVPGVGPVLRPCNERPEA